MSSGPSTGSSTNLDPKVAGLLAYLVGWISGLILFVVEKEHAEVRYHAAQSILVSVVLIPVFVVLGVLGAIPVIGLIFWVVSLLLGFASFGLWIYLLLQGYNLNHVRLPVIGGIAERWAEAPVG